MVGVADNLLLLNSMDQREGDIKLFDVCQESSPNLATITLCGLFLSRIQLRDSEESHCFFMTSCVMQRNIAFLFIVCKHRR